MPLMNPFKTPGDLLSWRLMDRFPTATNLTLNYLSLDQLTEAEELYGKLGSSRHSYRRISEALL
uniref:Renin receptor isoform x4 n=1 Tax=Triatoma infestans TaxID=30076 RepID=A0A170YQX7_TRIIF